MSYMTPDSIAEFVNIPMVAGQVISIQILNADGSVASTLFHDIVPAGFTFEGVAAYSGNFSAQ